MSTTDDTKDLRAAAARLATREAEIVGVDPIEKPALSALIEQAIPDEYRGLTYPQEIEDIGDWLTSVSKVHEEESTRLIAQGAASLCQEIGVEVDLAGVAMLRAIAAYFVHEYADRLHALAEEPETEVLRAAARFPDRWSEATIACADSLARSGQLAPSDWEPVLDRFETEVTQRIIKEMNELADARGTEEGQ